MQDLTGKVAIITGAKGGLGSFVTKAFLDAGAAVAGVSRSISDADFAHPQFLGVAAELSSRAAAESVMETVRTRFGRVDVVVHLMGGFAGGTNVADTDDATFERMVDLNLRSTFHVLGAGARVMRDQGRGRLLAIASKSAVEASPGSGVYAASKAAVVSLVRTFAAELRDSGVTVNVVLPGTMDTPQNRAAMPQANPSQWVQPSEVALLLVHLASDASNGISGAAIPIYGADV
jgi:NAD(P)-dependent dehydrogenase (short-subunit alcohol dehydrogenase family)